MNRRKSTLSSLNELENSFISDSLINKKENDDFDDDVDLESDLEDEIESQFSASSLISNKSVKTQSMLKSNKSEISSPLNYMKNEEKINKRIESYKNFKNVSFDNFDKKAPVKKTKRSFKMSDIPSSMLFEVI